MTGELLDADYRELLLLRIGLRRFLRLSEDFAREAGLTPAQHQLLLAIRGHADPAGPTIGDVAGYLLLRHHSAVELVNRAAHAGVVLRTTDPVDARAVRLSLTDAGQRALARLSEQHVAELRRLAEHFRPLLAGLGGTSHVVVARVYESPVPAGRRLLVDRLWPRGFKKDELELEWRKDLAPSDALRKWYGHDSARFREFSARYEHELEQRAPDLAALASGDDPVVLLTATKDLDHSHALVLARKIEAARDEPATGD